MPSSGERSDANERLRVPAEQLRWTCDGAGLDFETTADLSACAETIAQDRAVRAIRLGLAVESRGYNIFVAGTPGTGRTSTALRLLRENLGEGPPPDDLVYVHNFQEPDQPSLLCFPAGRGRAFRRAMGELVENLVENVPRIFEDEGYRDRHKQTVEGFQEQQKQAIRAFEKKVEEQGFAMVQVQMGPFTRPDLVPVVAGNPIGMTDLEKLVEQGKFNAEELEKLKERYGDLARELEEVTSQVRRIEQAARESLERLRLEAAAPLLDEAVREIRDAFAEVEGLKGYLEAMREDLAAQIDRFTRKEGEEAQEGLRGEAVDSFLEYRVNLLVDNGGVEGPPVVVETSPTYRNLFGTVERSREPSGEWRSDFTKIKAGSIHRARGGYLVLNALDVLVETGVWPTLKRMLRNQMAEIQPFEPLMVFATSAMKPEAIPLKIKVVMIGTRMIYHLLRSRDEDFEKVFRIKADFDSETKRDADMVRNYACFIAKVCDEENLPAFTSKAVAAVVEEGVRIAGRQDRMTTRFHLVQDLVRESAYWARSQGAEQVGAEHVLTAIRERDYRMDLPEEKLREMIARGDILLDVDGSEVGQVNGLAVYDLGDYRFGKPARITASVSMGRAGIIDIERESSLSGSSHIKGMLILSGFLRERFAQDKPLAVSASVCFEQSYGGIDGDSASSTEVYALLSSLSDLPLRQDLAVTGSVNQWGEVQVIGGVNEKIEGFFKVCRAKGLTGRQGVLVPARNVDNLMLSHEVVDAVREGRFHLYAVSTIEEGIELLSGVPAGEPDEGGGYPEGTVYGRADRRLRELAEGLRRWSAPVAEVLPEA